MKLLKDIITWQINNLALLYKKMRVGMRNRQNPDATGSMGQRKKAIMMGCRGGRRCRCK